MNIILKVKKVGNHWYPNIAHDCYTDITLNDKVEKTLSILDKNNYGTLEFLIYEIHSWTNEDVIQFNEKDLWTYINTSDQFDLTFYIRDHQFKVSSNKGSVTLTKDNIFITLSPYFFPIYPIIICPFFFFHLGCLVESFMLILWITL